MNAASLRILGLTLAALALAYGLLGESHAVHGFIGDETRVLPGVAWAEAPDTSPWWPAGFCEGATVDGFVRQSDGLYSVFTTASGQASLRDCKT